MYSGFYIKDTKSQHMVSWIFSFSGRQGNINWRNLFFWKCNWWSRSIIISARRPVAIIIPEVKIIHDCNFFSGGGLQKIKGGWIIIPGIFSPIVHIDRWHSFACGLTMSWDWSRSQRFGCSPIKVVRELGLPDFILGRETVWSLSFVGVGPIIWFGWGDLFLVREDRNGPTNGVPVVAPAALLGS